MHRSTVQYASILTNASIHCTAGQQCLIGCTRLYPPSLKVSPNFVDPLIVLMCSGSCPLNSQQKMDPRKASLMWQICGILVRKWRICVTQWRSFRYTPSPRLISPSWIAVPQSHPIWFKFGESEWHNPSVCDRSVESELQKSRITWSTNTAISNDLGCTIFLKQWSKNTAYE